MQILQLKAEHVQMDMKHAIPFEGSLEMLPAGRDEDRTHAAMA